MKFLTHWYFYDSITLYTIFQLRSLPIKSRFIYQHNSETHIQLSLPLYTSACFVYIAFFHPCMVFFILTIFVCGPLRSQSAYSCFIISSTRMLATNQKMLSHHGGQGPSGVRSSPFYQFNIELMWSYLLFLRLAEEKRSKSPFKRRARSMEREDIKPVAMPPGKPSMALVVSLCARHGDREHQHY